ncbi:MAG: hypothetical protein ABSC64_02290 [Candidatus Korobacteraceae bacterium]
MTPEEAIELTEKLNEAFKPFMDSVINAFVALAEWAEENKELFERVKAELERIEKEMESEKC